MTPSSNPAKEYLGDGVYADVSRFGELVLTTENGITVTNSIVLDAQVLDALAQFIERHKKGSTE